VQEELKGQSHAVLLAKNVVEGPVLLTYCDTLNQIDFSFLNEENVDGMASVLEVEDPSRHGIAITGPYNLITKLVEKPKTLEHKSALTGFYYFSEGKDLIKAIETQIQRGASLNNEYYLADAINILIENGMRIRAQKALQWLDAGTPDDMLKTNALLLQQNSDLAPQTRVGNSNVLVQPVYIHESARVENSVIGPNVAIGANCSISGSVIKNAIIDDQTTVLNAVLDSTLLGRRCTLSGSPISILADQQELNISYSTP
jgi:glucose-1-phosphate thymidylyltransferase